jgi:uncharacterized protein (TIGR00730 family)
MRYCVFSGSSLGARPEYAAAAATLGRLLAGRGIGLVYGGSSVGLMGVIADSVLEHGGEAIGVIPQFLVDREVAHGGVRDLRVTSSMHERKALMADLADGFIALPGGLGTLEETFEIWTWRQLDQHTKPCALLNTAGYYDALGLFLDHVVRERFLKAQYRSMLMCEADPETLLEKLARPAALINDGERASDDVR